MNPAHRCCRVEKGSWIVKQAVGQNTPVLLGKKLTTKYFTGPNYIEVGWRTNQIGSCASTVGPDTLLYIFCTCADESIIVAQITVSDMHITNPAG
jgi:Protein ENHANCED DISEASE RESISTANCE 2, C-terminal